MLFFSQSGRHVGFDKTRRHTVDGDVSAAQLARQGAGHAGHTGFSSSIVGLARVARSADDAGNTDDAAIALLHHGPHDGTRQAENSFEIGVKDRIPIVVFHPHGQGVAGDASVVYQYMQGFVLGGDLLDQGVHRGGVIHIQIGTTAFGVGG